MSHELDQRRWADILGKREQAKGTKGWDGKDLNDKDARLYGLRKAGYSSWIDKDGYPDKGK
jgi:hypothetical protein